jgi:hypothetical protein
MTANTDNLSWLTAKTWTETLSRVDINDGHE